jgi:hypothetical protein
VGGRRQHPAGCRERQCARRRERQDAACGAEAFRGAWTGRGGIARVNAENAFFAGDSGQYRWWLGICRMLDRRMADAVAARQGASGQG